MSLPERTTSGWIRMGCVTQTGKNTAGSRTKHGARSAAFGASGQVGPVLAACNGAFGMTSAALPMVFKALQPGPRDEGGSMGQRYPGRRTKLRLVKIHARPQKL